MQKQIWQSLDEAGSDEENLEGLFKKAWSRAVHGYIRWAIAAGHPGPDGVVSMGILGKEETLRRFELAKEVMMAVKDDGADMAMAMSEPVPGRKAPDREVESEAALEQETGVSDGGDGRGGSGGD